MPTENRRTYVVGGTAEVVYRSRAVFISDDFKCTMMTAANISFAPLGIAQEWARQPPGTPYNTSMQAGVSGDEIMVYCAGSEALAEVGSAGVTAGRMVTADATGRIVDSAGAAAGVSCAWDLGFSNEDGTAGDVVRMRVMPTARGAQ